MVFLRLKFAGRDFGIQAGVIPSRVRVMDGDLETAETAGRADNRDR
jgi:hypothetical protein